VGQGRHVDVMDVHPTQILDVPVVLDLAEYN
jgi:hypothetical protein